MTQVVSTKADCESLGERISEAWRIMGTSFVRWECLSVGKKGAKRK